MTTIQCSNCLTGLTLSKAAGTISLRVPASGRGSKRVEARTITSDVWTEPGLLVWEAPCCDDYVDSLDITEETP